MQFRSTSDPKIRFTNRRKNFFLPKGLGKHHLGHLDSLCCPKWVSNSTTCPSTVISKSTTVVHSNASGLCEDADPQGGGYSIITKTCHRRSQDMSPKTGLLQSNLPSEEEVRRVETSHRFVSSEQIRPLSTFQNGDSGHSQDVFTERRLGDISRFERCLFSYSDSSEVSPLSQILFQRENISVSGSPIWALSEPVCVFPCSESRFEACPPARYSSARLPGRLATTVCFRSPVLATQQKTSEHYTGTRICPQLGEIRTGSNTEILFSRSPVQLDQRSGGSFFGENINFSTGVNSTVECQTSFSSSVAFHCRTDGINGESSSLGEVTQEVSPVGNQGEMVPGRLSLGTTNQATSLVPQGCATMARQGVFNVLVSNPSSPSRLSVVHRLKSGWVGSTPRQSYGLGHMACRMERTTYQCPRAKSSLPGSSGIYRSCSESFHFVGNRQQNGSSSHQQTGGDSFQDPVQSDNAGCIVVCRAQGIPEGTVPPREIEHLGRLPFKENESCSDRVVIEPESGRSDMSAMELSSNRSLCYSAEQEVSSVCVTCSRPRGICSGCSFDQLERDVSICVSSISSDITMSQEDTDRGVLSLVNCSSLGGTTLVSSPTIITGCSSTTASSESRSVVSTGISDVTSHARHLSSSRLFAMQQQMEASGISRAVAQRIYSSKRSSTNNLYDYRWKSWVDWCIRRQMDPCNPTINGFAEFLIFLHNKNFCPATVKGYRSAISTTLKQISKIDFSNESVLSDVVKSFELERPRLRSHFPKWDLTLVLSSLLAPPYEPLESCGFKELTLKTVFLIAFASGRRRSEVHAFSVTDVQFSDQSVTLFTFPGFLAKNQLPSVLSPAICIPALKGQGDTPLLCPVRALRIYLTRVFPRRKNRKRVFISHLENYQKEISSDTVSRWIVQTIRFAYEGSSLELPKVNAHEVRALAPSWAWFNRVALEDILRASYWSSENSFIRFYLRDISTLSRSLARLGPMVAAQSVIMPSTISSV